MSSGAVIVGYFTFINLEAPFYNFPNCLAFLLFVLIWVSQTGSRPCFVFKWPHCHLTILAPIHLMLKSQCVINSINKTESQKVPLKKIILTGTWMLMVLYFLFYYTPTNKVLERYIVEFS